MGKTRKDFTRYAFMKKMLEHLGYEIPNDKDELMDTYWELYSNNEGLFAKAYSDLGFGIMAGCKTGYKYAKKWSKGARRTKERSNGFNDEDKAGYDDFKKGKRRWGM